MAEHTPGPWRNDMRGSLLVVGGEPERIVAGCWGHSDELLDEGVANARLIASAPELLAALEAYQDWPDASERAAIENSPANLDAESEAADRFHRLREAAIRKARGEASSVR